MDLNDLVKMAEDMSDEELAEKLEEIRKNRNIRQRGRKKVKVVDIGEGGEKKKRVSKKKIDEAKQKAIDSIIDDLEL